MRSRAPSARSRAATREFQIHAAPDVTLEQDLARRDLTITHWRATKPDGSSTLSAARPISSAGCSGT